MKTILSVLIGAIVAFFGWQEAPAIPDGGAGSPEGFWEEGYYYYLEIRGDSLTLRDSARRIVLETGYAAERAQTAVLQILPVKTEIGCAGFHMNESQLVSIIMEDGAMKLTIRWRYSGEEKVFSLFGFATENCARQKSCMTRTRSITALRKPWMRRERAQRSHGGSCTPHNSAARQAMSFLPSAARKSPEVPPGTFEICNCVWQKPICRLATTFVWCCFHP